MIVSPPASTGPGSAVHAVQAAAPGARNADRCSVWVRRLGVLAGLLGGLLLAGLVGAGAADAHALLTKTTPADEASLEQPPTTVELTFSESVGTDLGYVRVIDNKSGERVDDGVVTHPAGRSDTVSVGLDDIGDGGYVVSYRVISADSHPISGSFTFGVGEAAPTESTPAQSATNTPQTAPADPVVAVLYPIARWVGYAGIVLLGGAVALRTCWPESLGRDRAWRLLWTGWGALVVGTVLCVLLQGAYAAGRGVLSVFDLSLLDATLRTNYGRMLCLRLVIAAVLGVLMARARSTGRPARWLEATWVLAGLGTALTFSASGHAVAGFAPWLTMASGALHLAASAVWMGGIVVVLAVLLPMAGDAEVIAGLRRFSRIAMTSVGVIAVSGTYQAWREIREWDALWDSRYGTLVLIKIAAFVVLVGLGALAQTRIRNRFVAVARERRPVPVTAGASGADSDAGSDADSGADSGGGSDSDDDPPPDRNDQLVAARRTLGWSVLVEAAIGAAVLVVVALLVATPPARTTYSQPVDRELSLPGGGSTQLTVDPARRGTNTVHIYLFDDSGALTDADQVTVAAEQKSEQVGPLDLSLTKAGTGHWIAAGSNLPVSGTWTFTVTVQSGEFDSSVASTTVDLR